MRVARSTQQGICRNRSLIESDGRLTWGENGPLLSPAGKPLGAARKLADFPRYLAFSYFHVAAMEAATGRPADAERNFLRAAEIETGEERNLRCGDQGRKDLSFHCNSLETAQSGAIATRGASEPSEPELRQGSVLRAALIQAGRARPIDLKGRLAPRLIARRSCRW